MLSDDTVSLRHLPRRSSKNCDLQFANGDRFKANYSVDFNLQCGQHPQDFRWRLREVFVQEWQWAEVAMQPGIERSNGCVHCCNTDIFFE